jgi:hypothetical protein
MLNILYCTFNLRSMSPIWLFSVVTWLYTFLVCCSGIFWIILKYFLLPLLLLVPHLSSSSSSSSSSSHAVVQNSEMNYRPMSIFIQFHFQQPSMLYLLWSSHFCYTHYFVGCEHLASTVCISLSPFLYATEATQNHFGLSHCHYCHVPAQLKANAKHSSDQTGFPLNLNPPTPTP